MFEIFEMGGIGKNLPGDHERDPGARRGVHCDMHALFRADTSKDKRVTALFRQESIVRSIVRSIVDGDPVEYRVDEAWAWRADLVLCLRYAVEPGGRAGRAQRAGRVPLDRQVQCRQDRDVRRRKTLGEIDPMHMNDINIVG